MTADGPRSDSRRSVRRRHRLPRIVIPLLGAIAVIGFGAWYLLLREVKPRFADDFEHFKYGSVGVEAANGVPYWIWYVLPAVCGDRPAGREGYAPYGFIWEEGQRAPIGLPVMTVGFPRVGVNCGLCHVGTLRTGERAAGSPSAGAATGEPAIAGAVTARAVNAGAATRTLLPGAPTTTVDLQGYLRFLFACAESPRFTADAVLREIARVQALPLAERLLYRILVIPQMKRALLKQKAQMTWMAQNPDWGPGRSDPFNPAKVQLLGLMPDGSIGNSDAEPLWQMSKRRGFGMHWDGLNDSFREIVLNSGIGNGATAKTVDVPSLDRIQAWVTTLKPPPYPFAIDRALAAEGSRVFAAECGACHAPGGSKTGMAIDQATLGTDHYRLASWSQKVADRFNALDGYDWRYSRFRGTYGYAAVPLDGIWTRAPYLHNGSVPYLADLLKPPAERPAVLWRGYDVYDPARVGFLADGPDAQAHGWKLDTSLPGNSNAGHAWGTALPAGLKQALLEYLKTL